MSYQTLQASMLKGDAQKQIRLVTAADVKPIKLDVVRRDARPAVAEVNTETVASGPLSSRLRTLIWSGVHQIAVTHDEDHYTVRWSMDRFLPIRLYDNTTQEQRSSRLPHCRTIKTTELRRLRMVVQMNSLDRLVATRHGNAYQVEWSYRS